MAKQKFKITNWPIYNKALINRGSLTFWLDNEAIQAWYESATPSSRGRPQRYSDLAITTVLVIKRVFRLTLRAVQGFIDSIFTLMNVPLRCPDYTSVSKRAKSVNVSFKTPTRGEIAHLVIDSTGLKVFGEGEWKVKKHGKERRRIWRKLHLAVDGNTHEMALLQKSAGDKLIFTFLLTEQHMNPFKGRHFQRDIILWAVRWHCKYGISYRELQEMLAERGVNVDHSTIGSASN